MTGYRLPPSAEEDMDVIWDYTCRTRSAARADRYIDDLFDAFDRLAQTPELGQQTFVVASGYRGFASITTLSSIAKWRLT